MREKRELIIISKKFISLFLVVNICINLLFASAIIPKSEEKIKKINEAILNEEKRMAGTKSIDEIIEIQEDEDFRDEVEIKENVVMFVMSQIVRQGEVLEYINDESALANEFGMHNIENITEVINLENAYATQYYVTYKAKVSGDEWTVVDKLNGRKDIIGAEPCYTYETGTMPSYISAPYMQTQWYLDDLNMVDNWKAMEDNNFIPGEGVTVAVIDTGIMTTHPALKNSLWVNEKEIPDNGSDDDRNGYVDDYYGVNVVTRNGNVEDDNGHGTNMSSIIAMQGVGGKSGSGIAYAAKILTVKAADAKGEFTQDDVASGINYAVAQGAEIINMSFGGESSVLIEVAVQNAYKKGHILIAAAGNDGLPTSDSARVFGKKYKQLDNYPAASPYVIGVMAYNQNKHLASYSNWDYKPGNKIEYNLIAPGSNMYCADIGNTGYIYTSGTSAATAVVASIAANYRSIYKSKEKYNFKYIINKLKGNDYVNYVDIAGKAHKFRKVNSNLKLAASTIDKVGIELCTIIPEEKIVEYTGEALEVPIKVMYGKKELSPEYYDVSYSSNIHIGKCAITITGKTNKAYGTKIEYINIVPKKIEGITAKSEGKRTIKISWECNNICDGYEIYRYDEINKKYIMISDLYDKTINNYTDTNLGDGTNYKYVVCGYKIQNQERYKSKVSDEVEAFTPIGKTEADYRCESSSKVVLNWKKVSGATGYEIFKYNSESQRYKKIGEVEGQVLRYEDSELESLKKYYYVVRATRNIGDEIMYGEYSDKVKAYTGPSKITEFDIDIEGDAKVLTYWNQVEDASGYQIYVSDSINGTYKLITNVNPQYIKVRIRNIPLDKGFFYKVRAFKKINGKYVFGDFTDAKLIKAM